MTLFTRELLVTWRNPQLIFQPLLFFILTLCLFPIGLGTDANTLANIAPAALWIALLLAALLAGEQLFAADYQDGTLSQDAIHLPLWLLVGIKIAAAWLRFILPLLLALPLVALMLHIPLARLPITALLMATGSLALLLIAAIGAALTLTQSQATFLRYLIVIPLYLPVLIIGVTASADHFLGLPVHGHAALLAAFTLFSLIAMIPFTALAIRAQPLP
ncbi:MAG: heme exporter protein CcmB [Cardiobacteriaceae bacterium]|nr:heme exporter protein CcmB [Cardiobacteriaceae bacterium]